MANKKNLTVVMSMLYNIVVVICLTVLAWLFSKWWIVLFAILFFAEPKTIIERKSENEDT